MTKPLCVTIPHELGVAEARRRIDEGVAGLIEKAGAGGLAQFTRTWDGDHMNFNARAMGQVVSGRLQVLDKEIRMEIDLPAFLAVIGNAIGGRLRKQGTLLLGKK